MTKSEKKQLLQDITELITKAVMVSAIVHLLGRQTGATGLLEKFFLSLGGEAFVRDASHNAAKGFADAVDSFGVL